MLENLKHILPLSSDKYIVHKIATTVHIWQFHIKAERRSEAGWETVHACTHVTFSGSEIPQYFLLKFFPW